MKKLEELVNFLRPSMLEVGLWIFSIPFLSLPIYRTINQITNDYKQAIVYALIPQILEYIGVRAIELGILGKNLAKRFKHLKHYT